MSLLRRLPASLSLLLLGALALRLGTPFLLALPATVLVLVLLFLRGPRTLLALEILLWAGAAGWLAMAYLRVQDRLAMGQPWIRLVCILVGTAIFTGFSAWLLTRIPRRT